MNKIELAVINWDDTNHKKKHISLTGLVEKNSEKIRKEYIDFIDNISNHNINSLSVNSALKIDGSDLLNKEELECIYKARDELEEKLNSGEKESIVDAVKNLEKVSETYVSRRMNSNIQKIMKGTDIKEFN